MFFSSLGWAQYPQFVKPTTINNIFNYVRHEYKSNLNDFLSHSRELFTVNDQRLDFESKTPCNKSDKGYSSTTMQVMRSIPTSSKNGLRLIEKVMLEVCNNQIELLSIDRQGLQLTATPDVELLRGNIPPTDGASYYKLQLARQKLSIEIFKKDDKEQMQFKVHIGSNSNEYLIEAKVSEIKSGEILNDQTAKISVFNEGILVKDYTTQYIWQIDAATGVPRQYLYYSHGENSSEKDKYPEGRIPPEFYIGLMDAFYSQSLYNFSHIVLMFNSIIFSN